MDSRLQQLQYRPTHIPQIKQQSLYVVQGDRINQQKLYAKKINKNVDHPYILATLI